MLAEDFLSEHRVHAIPAPVDRLFGRVVGESLHEQRIADQDDLFVAVAERLHQGDRHVLANAGRGDRHAVRGKDDAHRETVDGQRRS